MRLTATTTISAVFSLLFALAVQAGTSLWVPDTDPQALSAGIVGVGNDGRTTWEIQQGTPSGTFTKPGALGFSIKATLVEGPSDAILTAALTPSVPLAVAVSCTMKHSVAVCAETLSQGSTVITDTKTETMTSVVIQGGGTITPSAPTMTGVSAGLSPTSLSPNPTGTAGGNNGASRSQFVGGFWVLGLVGSMINCARLW